MMDEITIDCLDFKEWLSSLPDGGTHYYTREVRVDKVLTRVRVTVFPDRRVKIQIST